MPEALLSDRQRTALRQLVALTADRARAEVEIVQTYTTTGAALDAEYEASRQALEDRYQRDTRAAEKAFRADLKRMGGEFETEYAATEKDYKDGLSYIARKAEANEIATRKALQEAIWLTETVFEATETQPIEQFQTARKDVEGKREEFQAIQDKAETLLRRFRQKLPAVGGSGAPPQLSEADQPQAIMNERVNQAQASLEQLQGLFVPRVFVGLWPVLFILLVMLVVAGGFGLARGWQVEQWVGAAAGIGLAVGLALLGLLYLAARSQCSRAYLPLLEAIEQGRAASISVLQLAEQARDAHKATLIAQRDRDLRLAHEKYDPVLAKIQSRRAHHVERLNHKYPKLLEELKAKHDADRQALTGRRHSELSELTSAHDRASGELQQRYAERKQDNQQRYETDWNALENRWKEGMAEVHEAVAEVSAESARLFPPWGDRSWHDWRPPLEFAPVIRFGQMHVDQRAIPGGLPKDERLFVPGPQQFDVPAMLAFPDLCSMLIQAGDDGRDEAVATLQTVMFRLLTTLPPGKVRFTIIDPVGLGQNFAGFMHLADYEGAFVADKIWTEDRHIEQRLLDLTEHMENVIQKYLRNEYETIGDYNVDAGEIAEPFRFLVIANFPVNFSETAARRLASIINSGARCGVYTLITVDTRQPLPQGIQMSDLERNSAKLAFDAATRRFLWIDEDYQRFPLTLDAPPAEEFVTEKLHLIGQAAKESTRVEVPFDVIAPEDGQLWSLNTTSDLRVALGRAGATKLQYLTLGVGTSQHALVAGKTGSGKSTLLHALVTNLALWYPPNEVEFYLVDFKKGVEFKTYATHSLPHARAVAIESDREFGLSVLQRLDGELKHRGNIFRDLGVQDLAGYRRTDFARENPIPRTLLIIDEFQELFTEDDKIGQDAALLLDRLVRQGRAFGMHVLLGSQTLGGAYSLARSTINQMAVRIALQCSEADSYLILSDDNAAARLLSRPGEAIYNDASGMVEGNNPFQIVWLPDDKREQCLNRINAAAEQRNYHPPEPQIVFEGNVPAEIHRNHLLEELLERRDRTSRALAPTAPRSAWLGEAIAIKDPTAAVFRRQSGNNLIIVGQREESSLAMLATSLISLAAQHSPETGPGGAKFYILDGSADDSPHAGYLAKLAGLLPHQVQVVPWRDVPGAINEIAEEIDRRTQSHHDADTPSIYLLIYGLQRYRMLRQEDDFGMSSSSSFGDGEAAPKPDKQFGAIIREGPPHGVHTLAWCDTVNNLNRSLDRSGLKEFEIRVLFQMGASDSANLIDSPLASRLGLHRAIFFAEEQGQLEKFRPYALPDDAWLEQAGRALGAKAPASPRAGTEQATTR